MKLSARSRRSIVAAAAALTFTAGMAGAQAGLLGVSGSVTTSQTFALPVVPTTYHSLAGGAATAYTPSLQGAMVTVSVTSSIANVGAVVANSGFNCPSDAPNPVASIGLAGVGSVTKVKARITGTTRLPDGTPTAYDVTLDPGQVQLSGNGMELYSVCSA